MDFGRKLRYHGEALNSVPLGKSAMHTTSTAENVAQSAPASTPRSANQQALIAAVNANDVEKAERALLDGANPNAFDQYGRTALRHAVDKDFYELAACLLFHGADYRIADNQGKEALNVDDIGLEKLHRVRQRYHRYKSRAILDRPIDSDIALAADAFEANGIIKLSGLIDAELLHQLRKDFGKFIREMYDMASRNEGYYQHYDQEQHIWSKDKAIITNNAFKYSSALVALAVNPIITQIVDRYLGRTAHIQRAVGMRYHPTEHSSHDMFGWHHDMEDRRVKAKILLTDLTDQDQYMAYILGSNKIYHEQKMFYKNPCMPDYVYSHIGQAETFRTVGTAGDVFLFDSNGAHRGNRFPHSTIRDAIFIEYSGDKSQVWGGDIDEAVVAGLGLGDNHPLKRMMSVTKKWHLPKTRTAPDWVDTLPNLERWI